MADPPRVLCGGRIAGISSVGPDPGTRRGANGEHPGPAEPGVVDVVAVMGRVRQAIEQVIEGKREAIDLALVVLLA